MGYSRIYGGRLKGVRFKILQETLHICWTFVLQLQRNVSRLDVLVYPYSIVLNIVGYAARQRWTLSCEMYRVPKTRRRAE